MFNTIGRSYRLVLESFNILRKDKEMLLFPFFSGVAGIVVFISFMLPLFYTDILRGGEMWGKSMYYVVVFLYYLASYFVIVFFDAFVEQW